MYIYKSKNVFAALEAIIGQELPDEGNPQLMREGRRLGKFGDNTTPSCSLRM